MEDRELAFSFVLSFFFFFFVNVISVKQWKKHKKSGQCFATNLWVTCQK